MALIATDPNLQISEQIAVYFNSLIQQNSIPNIPVTLPQLISPPIITRKGLDAAVLASTIVSGLDQINIPSGPLEDGTPNAIVALVNWMSFCIVQHFQTCGSVRVGIQEGQSIIGTGVSPSGPIAVQGVTDSPMEAFGVMQ